MERPRVLELTWMYPVPWNVAHGVFVRDHVAAIVRAGAQVEVVRTVAWVPPLIRRRWR
jgi:hypothetical protein